MTNNKDFKDHFKIFDEIDNMVMPKDPNKSIKNLPKNYNKQTFGMKPTNNINNNDIKNKNNSKTKSYMNSPTTDKNKNIKSSEYTPNMIDFDRKKPVHLNQYVNYKQDTNLVGTHVKKDHLANSSTFSKNNNINNNNKLKKNLSIKNFRPSSVNNNRGNSNNSNLWNIGHIGSNGNSNSNLSQYNNNNNTNKIRGNSSSRFDKLYLDDKRVKEKIETKRQELKKNISNIANPKINDNSKNINRDSANFEERLYPYSGMNNYPQVINNNISNSNINIFVNIDGEDNIFNKYYRKNPVKNYDNFSYHPKISDKSAKIAEKLGSSFERLLKKKKRSKSNQNSLSDSGVQISRQSNASKQSGRSGRSTSSSKYIDTNLYQRGLELKKEREELYKKNKTDAIKNETKGCTFKPEIKKNISEFSRATNIDFFERQKLSIDAKEELLKMKRDLQIKKELENCSFKPNINELGISDDYDIINKHSDDLNEYVSKRKKIFEKKKDDMNYVKKIFKENPNDFIFKPTKVIKFDFRTDKNRRGLNKSIEYDTRKYNDKLMLNRGEFNLKGFFEKKDYGTVSSKRIEDGGENYGTKQSKNQILNFDDFTSKQSKQSINNNQYENEQENTIIRKESKENYNSKQSKTINNGDFGSKQVKQLNLNVDYGNKQTK